MEAGLPWSATVRDSLSVARLAAAFALLALTSGCGAGLSVPNKNTVPPDDAAAMSRWGCDRAAFGLSFGDQGLRSLGSGTG